MSLPAAKPSAHAHTLHPGHAAAGTRCTNCEAELHGPWCAQCGEKQPDHHDWTLGGLFHEAMHAFTHLDGTLWRTVRALLRSPGLLTTEYFAGRKTRYMRPIALFLVVNLVFFVIQPHTGLFGWSHDSYAKVDGRLARMEARRAELGLTPAEFRERFDHALDAKKRGILLVQIPLFALAVAGVQAHRRRPAAQHAVFAIHTYAFFGLYLGVLLIGIVFTFAGLALALRGVGLTTLAGAAMAVSRFFGNTGLNFVLTGGLGTWLAIASRRVYGDGWLLSAIKAALLVGAVAAMVIATPKVLFELALRLA